MSDIRLSFESTLRKYGHNILLQRRISEYTDDDPTFKNELERHTVRHMHPGSKALAGIAQEMDEGITHTSEMVYWFKFDVNPAPGDRIYENIELYPNSLSIFTIDKSIPMRGRGGQIAFWACGVTQEEPN